MARSALSESPSPSRSPAHAADVIRTYAGVCVASKTGFLAVPAEDVKTLNSFVTGVPSRVHGPWSATTRRVATMGPDALPAVSFAENVNGNGLALTKDGFGMPPGRIGG